jgi:hypothetical protein
MITVVAAVIGRDGKDIDHASSRLGSSSRDSGNFPEAKWSPVKH